MRKFSVWIVAVVTLFSLGLGEASAQVRSAGNIGVGIGSGTYVGGFSLKYFSSESLAFQGNIGVWNNWLGYRGYYRDPLYDDYCYRGRCQVFGLAVDALLEQPTILDSGEISLAWNVGGGLGLGVAPRTVGFGANFVLGLEFNIDALPLDVTLEYRPGLLISPFFSFDFINFGAHIRFFF
jgi:hypothetical protein